MAYSYDKNLAYWKERTKKFGAASIGYNCNEKLIYWDNVLRGHAISRLVTIKPGMKVLDSGTGTGYWAIKCAKNGSSVTGLDFSEELLQIAVAKARQADVEITWRHTALEQADLPANFFDIALSVTCLQHITERERQLEAVRRILQSLKTGGVFVLVEDTVVGDESPVSHYMLTYPQHGWISLVQSQGAQILKFLGVSFLRFSYAHVPPQVCAALDLMFGYVPWYRERATVTAFAFIKKQSSFQPRGASLS